MLIGIVAFNQYSKQRCAARCKAQYGNVKAADFLFSVNKSLCKKPTVAPVIGLWVCLHPERSYFREGSLKHGGITFLGVRGMFLPRAFLFFYIRR